MLPRKLVIIFRWISENSLEVMKMAAYLSVDMIALL